MKVLFNAIICLFCLFSQILWAQTGEQWSLLPKTPTPRTEVAVVNHQGKIYVFGGFTPKGITDQVEIYDPNSGTWSIGSPMPKALHHTSAVSTNGKIYIIGGFTGGLWFPQNITLEYDPSSDQWKEKSPMPTRRGALATGVINGKIYAVGGAHKKFLKLVNTDANEVYNPTTDQWKSLAPLPTPRDHLTLSVFKNTIYVIGGRVNVNYHENLDTNESYDPKSNQWKTLAPLPTARSGITSQTLHSKIYVFGGESGEGTFNQNEVYLPMENRWETQEPMPKSCHGLGSALLKGSIHLITGGPNPGGGGSQYHQVFTPQ